MEKSREIGKKKETFILQKNYGQQDYREYSFSKKERLQLLFKSSLLLIAGAYFFYRSYIAVPFLALLIPLYRKREKHILQKKRQTEIRMQFKDVILSVCASLKAGYAVENAFFEAEKEVRHLYGQESYVGREVEAIIQSVNSNIPIERALLDFGRRSGIKEIEDFSQIFAIGKRSSGNIPEIVEKTVMIISAKIEVKREIETVMSAKILEQRAMSMVPFGILLYVSLTSPGFFTPLYHNPFGVTVMTVCLFLYLLSFQIAEKITRIEV